MNNMQPRTYAFSRKDSFVIEKLVDEDEVMINHMVLGQGDEIPRHEANSNVHLLVLRGSMKLTLGEETSAHEGGQIVQIPFQTPMHIVNESTDTLEFFVVKSPSPRMM